MPIYDYKCSHCSHEIISVKQQHNAVDLITCPKCFNETLIKENAKYFETVWITKQAEKNKKQNT